MRGHYVKPSCTANVLHVVFWTLVMNFEIQELIQLKFQKYPSFINITKRKGNGIVGGKLVRPSIPAEFVLARDYGRVANPWLSECSLFRMAALGVSFETRNVNN